MRLRRSLLGAGTTIGHDPVGDSGQSRRRFLRRLALAASAGTLALRGSPVHGADEPRSPTALGVDLTQDQRAWGQAFLHRHATVDVHCHPGRFFLDQLPEDAPQVRALGAPFAQRATADLAAGHVAGALFAAVADLRVLEVSAKGIRASREFEPGEAYADYQRQIADLRQLVASRAASPGLAPADIRAALRSGHTAAVFAIEGGDFIEDRLDRVRAAHADGVRAITIVHYHVNQLGDIQTESPVHGGLTAVGRDVVRAMNAAGIIVDLAHATLEVTRDAVDVSTRPMMISHTNLSTATNSHPRLISIDHARLVTSHGGLIGSVPSGIGQQTFADYIASILRLIDAVGVEHVAIGTDMDANYRPVFTSYLDWSLLPAALYAAGLDERSVAAVMGENFLRVFRAAAA